jgi:hypothetical protein
MAVGWEGIYTMEGRKSKPAGDTNQQGFVQYVSLRNDIHQQVHLATRNRLNFKDERNDHTELALDLVYDIFLFPDLKIIAW